MCLNQNDAAQSGMNAVSKFMSGDFVGAAMAAISAVISLAKCFLSMGDGVGEAIDRERQFIEISEEMEQKIRDLEEQLGDTHAAISMLLDEIIAEAEINAENFAEYAQRTRDILADLDEGTISVQETSEALGSAWNELLSEAQRLGSEGSREMIAIIRDVRGRGLDVAEIWEYVDEKLHQGMDALATYISTFGDITGIQEEIAALSAELAGGNLEAQEAAAIQAEIIAKQQQLAQATADVTENWDFMQTAAISTFNAMRSQGYSFVEIIGLMQDQLSGIAEMAQQSGLEISAGLQAMTNMSSFIEQNKELASRIKSTHKLMIALGFFLPVPFSYRSGSRSV